MAATNIWIAVSAGGDELTLGECAGWGRRAGAGFPCVAGRLGPTYIPSGPGLPSQRHQVGSLPGLLPSRMRPLLLLFSCSVLSDCLQPCGLEPTRLLCPWNSPGENTGLDCHFLLQGIFLTYELNSCLLPLPGRFFANEPPRKPWTVLGGSLSFLSLDCDAGPRDREGALARFTCQGRSPCN